MRARLYLYDGRDTVLLDSRHHAGEPVARRLGHDWAVAGGAALGQQPLHLRHGYESLPARGTDYVQSPVALPPAQALHGHAEHLGRFSNTHIAVAHVSNS